MSEDQRCPKCGLLNPATALTCDCGFHFGSERHQAVWSQAESAKFKAYAHRSWIFPAIAWASQAVFVFAMRQIPDLRSLALLAMVVQFVLIIVGLYFGLKALSAGRKYLSRGARSAALTGVTISGGTIAHRVHGRARFHLSTPTLDASCPSS